MSGRVARAAAGGALPGGEIFTGRVRLGGPRQNPRAKCRPEFVGDERAPEEVAHDDKSRDTRGPRRT